MDGSGLDRGVVSIVIIFLFLLALLWFFLPFAVFGIKDLLQRIIYAVEANTKATEAMHETLKGNTPKTNTIKE